MIEEQLEPLSLKKSKDADKSKGSGSELNKKKLHLQLDKMPWEEVMMKIPMVTTTMMMRTSPWR
jgi:hypothetical protein